MLKKTTLQLLLELDEEQDAALEKGPEVEGIDIFQSREDEGREPSMRSGWNSSFEAMAGELLLASKLNDSKLETEELRLTVM